MCRHDHQLRFSSYSGASLAARNFRPLSGTQVSALLARTANAAQAGQYERYKATTLMEPSTIRSGWEDSFGTTTGLRLWSCLYRPGARGSVN